MLPFENTGWCMDMGHSKLLMQMLKTSRSRPQVESGKHACA
jgi:hypothetical protein